MTYSAPTNKHPDNKTYVGGDIALPNTIFHAGIVKSDPISPSETTQLQFNIVAPAKRSGSLGPERRGCETYPSAASGSSASAPLELVSSVCPPQVTLSLPSSSMRTTI